MADAVGLLNAAALVTRGDLVVLVAVLSNTRLGGRVTIVGRVSLSARNVHADIVVEQEVRAVCMIPC